MEAFDPEAMEMLRSLDDDGTFVNELIEIFLADGDVDMASLRAAIADDDRDAARRCAHRTKGAAANLGLTALAATLKAVELNAETAENEVLVDALTHVEREFRGARTYLEGLRV